MLLLPSLIWFLAVGLNSAVLATELSIYPTNRLATYACREVTQQLQDFFGEDTVEVYSSDYTENGG